MKKQLIAIATLAVLSTPAFATKARMLALGENIQDNIGSLYFSDSRNIFQNAAYANDYKNMIIMEWGASGTGPAAAGSVKGDADKNPQAEGGFLKSHGNYVYGLYVGAESPYTNEIRSYTRSILNDNFHQDNQLDGFFAGESAALGKWGTNITYSNSKNDAQKAKQESMSVRFGFIKEKLEGFANVAVINKASIQSRTLAPPGTLINGKDKFEGKRGFELGSTYDATFAKVFAYVRHASWRHDADSLSAASYTAYTGKFDGTYWLYQVGLGKEHKVSEKATIFTKAEYLNFVRTVKAVSGADNGSKVEINDYRVPVTIGLEYDAASWLTLRGSVVQNLMSQIDNDYDGATTLSPGVKGKKPEGKRTIANSTNVNAGMTLKFGELSIDGVIGTDGVNNDTATETGALTLDNLASRVAMTYKF